MRFLIFAVMTATLLASGSVAGEDDDNRLYKWVDEHGNVTYQDRPPPDESGQVQSIGRTTEQSADETLDGTLPDVDLTLYSIDDCDSCDLVRKVLMERGVPFSEKDAEANVEVQEELKKVAGVLSVPTLAIGDEVITGYNKRWILKVLEEAGFPAATGDGTTSGSPAPLTPGELEQAAGGAAGDGPADDGFPAEDDIFSDTGGLAGDDIDQWEEIPEDERIRVGQ
jgi:glutaredoxin